MKIWLAALVALGCVDDPAVSRAMAAQKIAAALCARAHDCGDVTPSNACADNALEQLCGEGYDCGDGAADPSTLDACLSATLAMACRDVPDVGEGSAPTICRDVLLP